MALSENPNLALIPSGYKSGKIYSVLPTTGVGDFDFSRSGTATRINSQGLIETVADGVPRLNYPLIDGKVVGCPSHLLEPQRTNLFTYSEDLSNFSKTNITEVDGNQVTPNGTIGSIKITPTSSAVTELQISSLTVGTSYSLSFFVKKAEASHLIINQAGSAAQKISYDIGNVSYIGISGVDANIVSYGNEWVRVEYSVNSLTYNNIRIILSDGSDNYPYNPPIGDGLYLWGFQLEQSSFPTSYIPSLIGSQTTRSAETANNSGDASTFNDSEGVLMAEMSALADDGTARVITINDGGSSDYIGLRYHTVSNTIRFLIKSGGTTNFDYFITLPSTQEYNKIAIKYDNTNVYLWANGIEYFQFSPIITPIGLSTLDFDDSVGGDDFYGNIKQIQYFDSALNDSDLEKLTSWVSFSDMANGQLYTIE